MENTTMPTLSDVERNKELFEYEMTEVILQLKGEFAKVSGKDMHYDDALFAAQKPDIQVDIPKVTVDPVSVAEIHTDVDVSAAVSALQKTAAVTVDVDVPAVPQMKAPALGQIEVKPVEMELQTVKITPCEIPAVQITPPAVDTVSTELRMPEPIAAVKTDPVSVAQINTAIRLPEFSCDVKLQDNSVDVPDATLHFQELKPVTTTFTSPAVPEVPAVGTFKPTAVQLSEAPEIQVPGQIAAVNIPQVELTASEVPEIQVPGQIAAVSIPQAEVTVSEVPEIKAAKVAPFTPAALSPVVCDVETVAVPQIGAVSPGHVSIDPIQINVPQTEAVKPFRAAEQGVSDPTDVLSDIQSDYPTVSPVKIPSVTMEAPKQVEVPQPPDVSAFAQDILGSVV